MENRYIESPIGIIKISGDKNGVESIRFVEKIGKSDAVDGPVANAAKQLAEYFAGKRRDFDFKMQVEGTDFQKGVWSELGRIGFGEKRSYGQVAEAIGNPRASRAVGNANNRNKISIAIPCHRVVGSDGKLVGYASGEWRKKWLLEFEGG